MFLFLYQMQLNVFKNEFKKSFTKEKYFPFQGSHASKNTKRRDWKVDRWPCFLPGFEETKVHLIRRQASVF